MSNNLKNKIEAKDTNINKLLKEQKFTIDYFQREYRWKEKHVQLLVEDLIGTFLKSYRDGHRRSDVANYQNYYLGPVVFNILEGKKSIIDGQQRITTITLLLIYLNHLQKDISSKVNISDLIFSEAYGEKSFNMSEYSNENDMTLKIFTYIKKYNERRPHSALKGMSPLEYKNFLLKKEKK